LQLDGVCGCVCYEGSDALMYRNVSGIDLVFGEAPYFVQITLCSFRGRGPSLGLLTAASLPSRFKHLLSRFMISLIIANVMEVFAFQLS